MAQDRPLKRRSRWELVPKKMLLEALKTISFSRLMKMRVKLREDRVQIVLRPEKVRNLRKFQAKALFCSPRYWPRGQLQILEAVRHLHSDAIPWTVGVPIHYNRQADYDGP